MKRSQKCQLYVKLWFLIYLSTLTDTLMPSDDFIPELDFKLI